ncbi:MAG: hypothetical protein DMH00_05095, partial [Acidobacteria bacterium]
MRGSRWRKWATPATHGEPICISKCTATGSPSTPCPFSEAASSEFPADAENSLPEPVRPTQPLGETVSPDIDPAETARAGGPSGPTLSVIVPCFNEEKNLPLLVNRTNRALGNAAIPGEVVLVNDGSRDGTGAVIDLLAKQFQNVRAVHHASNRGIVEGWRSGLAASSGEWVLTTDADLQYAPEDIPRLYEAMKTGGWDLVQG